MQIKYKKYIYISHSNWDISFSIDSWIVKISLSIIKISSSIYFEFYLSCEIFKNYYEFKIRGLTFYKY